MKISKLFHWLYGAVMFLPILLIPVFMIYSHRHTIDSGTLEVPQQEVVDFNQIVRNGDFSTDDYWYAVSGSLSINDNECVYTASSSVGFFDNSIRQYYEYDCLGHTLYFSATLNPSENLKCGVAYGGATVYLDCTSNIDNYLYGVDIVEGYYPYLQVGIETPPPSIGATLNVRDVFIVDLTKMFGLGNEPTANQFKTWYDASYYDYTLSHKELLEVGTITYNDTDIMSQATYQLYNATDKYFNISQFFGLENLWDYMLLNWFGGNVTIYLRIFWQLLTYWLVVSIAWLIFDLFMYVPNLVHRWLDKGAIE